MIILVIDVEHEETRMAVTRRINAVAPWLKTIILEKHIPEAVNCEADRLSRIRK